MKKISKLVLLLVLCLVGIIFASCTKTYTVTFMKGEETIAVTTAVKGSKLYSVGVETGEGVIFAGWYETEDFDGDAFDFKNTAITANLTLYAKFVLKNYTISYSLGGAEGTTPEQQNVNTDGSFNVTATLPVWEGYEFKGWSDGSDLYNADDVYPAIKGDIILTAIWEYKTVHVRFFDSESVKIVGYDKEVPYGSDVLPPDKEVIPVPNFCFVNDGWDKPLSNVTIDTDFYATYRYVSSDLNLFNFSLNADKASYSIAAKNITKINGRIALPTEYNGLPVRTVAVRGFCYCYELTSLYIPSSYRTIKAEAFGVTGLTEIYIEEGLTTIEACAFQSVGLVTVFELPASLNDIHWWAFSYMFFDYLQNYKYLDDESKDVIDSFKFTTRSGGYYVWNEDDKALYGDNDKQLVFVSSSVIELNVKTNTERIYPQICENYPNLATVNILGNVAEIGPRAFAKCYKLNTFNISGSIAKLWGMEKNFLDGIENNSGGVFFESAIQNIVFPEGLNYIGEGTFFRCYLLTQITIPNTVQHISEQAFGNSLMHNTDYVSRAGQSAGGLQQIIIEGEGQYYYSDQNKAIIEKGTGINGGDTLLFYCMNASGSEYTIPQNVTVLTPFAFYCNKNITALMIPEGIEEIPVGCCQRMEKLSSITIPASVKYLTKEFPIKDEFGNSRWGGVYWVGGFGAFIACENLTEIIFAEDSLLEVIESNTFNCVGCSTINIPAHVNTIGSFALSGKNLTTITVDTQNMNYCAIDGVLFTKDQKTLMVYPRGKTETQYIIPDSVEIIAKGAFAGCGKLNKVIMGESVKSIGFRAFDSCHEKVYNEETWELINETGLTEVVMNASLEKIYDGAFINCNLLSKITFSGPAPQLVSGSFDEGYDRNIFGLPDEDTGEMILYNSLVFEVPQQYLLDYYIEWYNFRPRYVDGFNANELPQITYIFNTKGGDTVEDYLGIIINEMPIPTKTGAYFYGWYITDCNEQGQWDEAKEAVFPYIYNGGNAITLYARWENKQLENGQKDIWAYNLIPNKYILSEIPQGSYVWFTYTPTQNCRASLGGLDMVQVYNCFCLDELGVDIIREGWQVHLVSYDENRNFILTEDTTYYFVFYNGDDTDYVAYVTIEFFDFEGNQMIIYVAVIPEKFDLV